MRGFAMSIVAPKGRKHLSADALFRLVRSGFTNIPDYRPGDPDISWLFQYVISASMHADFRRILHESASHSRDYEHTPHMGGK